MQVDEGELYVRRADLRADASSAIELVESLHTSMAGPLQRMTPQRVSVRDAHQWSPSNEAAIRRQALQLSDTQFLLRDGHERFNDGGRAQVTFDVVQQNGSVGLKLRAIVRVTVEKIDQAAHAELCVSPPTNDGVDVIGHSLFDQVVQHARVCMPWTQRFTVRTENTSGKNCIEVNEFSSRLIADASPSLPGSRTMGLETEYGMTARVNGAVTNGLELMHELVQQSASVWPAYFQSPPTGTSRQYVPNGSRVYVDQHHPELATPEVPSALQVLAYSHAGDAILVQGANALIDLGFTGAEDIRIYRNNVDAIGTSFGSHENYAIDARLPAHVVVDRIASHLVSRTVFTGTGRIVAFPRHPITEELLEPEFHLSGRAHAIGKTFGTSTGTSNRAMCMVREEEPFSERTTRRLQVISGEAARHDVATFLRFATTSMVLRLAERGSPQLDALRLANPPRELHEVSRVGLEVKLPLNRGGAIGPVEHQQRIRELCVADAREFGASDEDLMALQLWGQVLDDLDRDWSTTVDRVDWALKLLTINKLAHRNDMRLDHSTLRHFDIDFHRIGPGSVFDRLSRAAGCVTLVTDHEIERAIAQAPAGRPAARAQLLSLHAQYPDEVMSVTWDTAVFERHRPTPRRLVVRMSDPQYIGEDLIDYVRSLL